MTKAKVGTKKKQKPADNDLVEKIHWLMALDGEAGLAVKVALLSGLRKSEMVYSYSEQICDSPNCCIGCKKLHVINKRNGMSIIAINWIQNDLTRCYFTMLPTILWQQFRNLPAFNEGDIKAADKVISKSIGTRFSDIRGTFRKTMSCIMNSKQVEILMGTADSSAAKYCLLFEIDELIERYRLAWEHVGLILPVL